MPTTPIEVWRLCEVSQEGALMTLYKAWNGARALPTSQWLKAEPFAKRINGWDTQLCGFHCYLFQSDAVAAMAEHANGKRCAVVTCEAIGVFPNPMGSSPHLADQLKLITIAATNY
jgi:hypothetical protein